MNRLVSTCALAILTAACGGGGNGGTTGSGSSGGNDAGGGGDAAVGVDASDPIDAAGGPPGLVYTDPSGGALRLVKNPAATATAMVLDFIVGDAPLTGYSTGFNLPLDARRVTLGRFMPGHALDPGTAPPAARAVIPDDGPLHGVLVVAQSQKAAGGGAVPTDTVLAPGTVLCTVELAVALPVQAGVVFDGSRAGFALPSGGLRNKVGTTIVDASRVKIGRLEVRTAQ